MNQKQLFNPLDIKTHKKTFPLASLFRIIGDFVGETPTSA